jgi:hypothetical protein
MSEEGRRAECKYLVKVSASGIACRFNSDIVTALLIRCSSSALGEPKDHVEK